MSDGGLDPRVEHLKQLKSDLADDFTTLNQSRNLICTAHLEQLEQIRARKNQDLDQWSTNERVSATRYRDSQYYLLDNDHDERLRQVDTRLADFLAFKVKLLRDRFPGAARHCERQGYAWPATDSRPPPPPHYPANLEIRTTDEPLLSPTEAGEDVRLIGRLTMHPADGRSLLGPLGRGSRARLEMPGMPPVPGSIGTVAQEYVEFVMATGKTLNISFRAIELKYAAITPE
jgi:hypothetical protein